MACKYELPDEAVAKLRDVAALVKSGKVGPNSVVTLTGAGISVACGIPDFRSPGGLYQTLRPELLTATDEEKDEMRRNPTFVVNRRLFENNQFPYCEVRRPFILGIAVGKWKPSLTHLFIGLCAAKGLLRRAYDQNIDCLTTALGLIPDSKYIAVHGSMMRVECEFCAFAPPGGIAEFAAQVKANIKDIYGIDESAPKASTNILCSKCKRAGLKPATVMYGGSMPPAFFDAVGEDFKRDKKPAASCAEGESRDHVQLLIVAGTSLQVQPAAGVAEMVPLSARRVLLNMEPAGSFDEEDPVRSDVVVLGPCDESALVLINELGWLEDAMQLREKLTEKSAERLDAFAKCLV